MREVVVTGLGAVTPIGNTVAEFSDALFSGKTGAARITHFDTSELPTKFAAEVKDFRSGYRDTKISFALTAVEEALAQAFGGARLDSTRAGLSIGIGLELFSMDHLIEYKSGQKPEMSDRRAQMTYLNTPADLCVDLISGKYGLTQPPIVHISACAASTDAIGTAFEMVRDGFWDVAVAGGTDSMINPMGVAGFCRIGALSKRNDSPESASRPFDETRDGFVIGEGAGFLVLETREAAEKRGAKILARISGYGNSLDAYSVSDPHPDGARSLMAMKTALASANLDAKDISAISAHGTGTDKNDPAETAAIKNLFGADAEKIPTFATKSMIGHLISAGGAVETIAAILCIRNGRVHHTANLEKIDARCGLRHVVDKPLEMEIKHILKNSFAFGGQNAVLVISNPEYR